MLDQPRCLAFAGNIHRPPINQGIDLAIENHNRQTILLPQGIDDADSCRAGCLDTRAGACRPSPSLNHDRCNGNEGFEAFVCFAAMHGDPSVFLKRQQALLKNLFPECPLPIGGVEIIRQLGRADCN